MVVLCACVSVTYYNFPMLAIIQTSGMFFVHLVLIWVALVSDFFKLISLARSHVFFSVLVNVTVLSSSMLFLFMQSYFGLLWLIIQSGCMLFIHAVFTVDYFIKFSFIFFSKVIYSIYFRSSFSLVGYSYIFSFFFFCLSFCTVDYFIYFHVSWGVITVMLFYQVLGTDELNAYLNKYRLELDPQLDSLVGRYVYPF